MTEKDKEINELRRTVAKFEKQIKNIDLYELECRFGKQVREVVEDMLNGTENRWHEKGENRPVEPRKTEGR